MEFLQKRGDLVMTFLTEGQSSSVVLYFLQSGYLFRGTASQKRIAVFKFSCSVDYFVAMEHAGYVCISIIHRTLTWTTGPLMYICDSFSCVYTRGRSF